MDPITGSSGPHSESADDCAPEPTIVCVDCGGTCFLITPPNEDGTWYPGDVVAYRCQDCRDRWDLVLPDDWGRDGSLA